MLFVNLRQICLHNDRGPGFYMRGLYQRQNQVERGMGTTGDDTRPKKSSKLKRKDEKINHLLLRRIKTEIFFGTFGKGQRWMGRGRLGLEGRSIKIMLCPS